MPRLALVAAAVLSAGCGDDDPNERGLFLKRFQDYARAPAHRRDAAFEAVREMRPRSDRVREVQAICVSAHDGLGRAEAEHAKAERLLGDLEARTRAAEDDASRKRLYADSEPAIREAVGASEEARRVADPAIERCFRLVEGLRHDDE